MPSDRRPAPGWLTDADPTQLDLVRTLVQRILALRSQVSGRPVLVAVDGRSGSGKTELAATLTGPLTTAGLDVTTVHLDDLYHGWSGLAAALGPLCEGVLSPLSEGLPGRYESWDWHRHQAGPVVEIAPCDVVIVEGVGAHAVPCSDLLDLSLWLDAPAPVRRERALARDGDVFAPHWEQWARQEEELLAERQPRADVRIDTETGIATWDRLGR